MMYALTALGLKTTPIDGALIVVRPRLTVDRIKVVTAKVFNVPLIEMRSNRRHQQHARARQVAMFLAREFTTKSLPSIGRIFGRDHSTVMHAIKTVERLIEIDEDFAADVDAVRSLLGGPVREALAA